MSILPQNRLSLEAHRQLIEERFYICSESPSGLRYKVSLRGPVKAGEVAGSCNHNGYWQIGIRVAGTYKKFQAHRIAYFLQTGVDPGELIVDHVKGVEKPLDLRGGTQSDNCSNAKKRLLINGKPTTSKYKGVSFFKQTQKWKVELTCKGKYYALGYYDDETIAARIYDAKIFELKGNKARLNFPEQINDLIDLSEANKKTSKYKGVYWYKQTKKWKASIKYQKKKIHIGYFDDEVTAALMYDAKAFELRGEKARLNFPHAV
jgi:hypothetical protein